MQDGVALEFSPIQVDGLVETIEENEENYVEWEVYPARRFEIGNIIKFSQ